MTGWEHQAPGGTTLEGLIEEFRSWFRRRLAKDATDPSRPENIAEVLSQLLAFTCAIETLLKEASRRSLAQAGGLGVPIRSLVEQLLSGEAVEGAATRLTVYFRSAIACFAATHLDVERKLDEFSRQLAEDLKPLRIREQAKASLLQRLLGLQEIAYWREYCRKFQLIDPDAMRDLASSVERGRGH